MQAKGTPETAVDASASGGPDAQTAPVAIDAQPAPDFDLPALVNEFQTPLIRYVTRLIGYPLDDVEDVVQDTFLRLHRQVTEQGPDSISNLKTWLFRVAHNKAMDVGRKRSRRKASRDHVVQEAVDSQKADASPQDLADALANREAREKAMEELDNLPDELREVVVLKIMEGMSMRQIAVVLDMSASNVCYRFNQALAELARRLKEKGVV